MITMEVRCLATLLALFAIATSCCLSTQNIPSKGVQRPPPTFVTETGKPRTYGAPAVTPPGNYQTPVVRKAQQPLYAPNPRLTSLNAAKNFNPQQPLKGELVNKNAINSKPAVGDKPQSFASSGSGAPRVPNVKPADSATSASSVAQPPPAQQSASLAASPVDDILKQMNVSGPVQTGASNVNINNNVSNIKVGNTKSENINYGIPALPRERLSGNQIDARKRAINDIASNYGSSGYPKQRPIVYENQFSPNYLFGEEDYFADNGGYNDGYESPDKQDLKLKPDEQKKCNKKKEKPTAEQVEVKNTLLDLASKAISSPVPDDEPLLKFNKETGALEQVQVDPNAQLYKNKLQEALSVLNPKKLGSKKLKKVLFDEPASDPENGSYSEGPYGAQQGYGYNNAPSGSGNLQRPDNRPQRGPAPRSGSYGTDDSSSQSYYSQLPPGQYGDFSSAFPSYNRANPGPQGNYPAKSEPIDLSTLDEDQRRSLVDQIRAILNDNLNRFNEVVVFGDDFLQQLLYVSDDELTPTESEFKHMILCNADERYCQRADSNEVPQNQQQYDDSAPEAAEYYNPSNTNYEEQEEAQEYSQPPSQYTDDYGANNYYEQPEEAEVVEQPEVGRGRYLGEPSEQQLEDELAPRGADGRHYSRQASSDSYLYKQSKGGARNGVPLAPQKHEYAEQSSFLRTNQNPPTVSARSGVLVEPSDGRFTGPRVQRQQQPRPQPASNFAGQSASPNELNNLARKESPYSPSGFTTPAEQASLVKRPPLVGKPQTAPNTFQLGGQQIRQQPQFNQQQARVPVASGLANTVAGRNANGANLGSSGAGNGGRILNLQYSPPKRA